jgi:hypothetical protein
MRPSAFGEWVTLCDAEAERPVTHQAEKADGLQAHQSVSREQLRVRHFAVLQDLGATGCAERERTHEDVLSLGAASRSYFPWSKAAIF